MCIDRRCVNVVMSDGATLRIRFSVQLHRFLKTPTGISPVNGDCKFN